MHRIMDEADLTKMDYIIVKSSIPDMQTFDRIILAKFELQICLWNELNIK